MRWDNQIWPAIALAVAAGMFAPEAVAHSPHDHIEAFAVSPDYLDDRTVLIVMRNHLFRTSDGGKTWRRIARGLDNRFQFMSAAMGGGMAYLATKGDGVFRSKDGGESWERVNAGFGTSNIRLLHLAGGKHVFAGSKAKGLWRAEVGKEVWKQVLKRGEKDRVTAVGSSKDGVIVVAGDLRSGVSVSKDGGETWSERQVLKEAGAIFSVIAWGNGGALLGTEKAGVVYLGPDGIVAAFGSETLPGGAVTALAETEGGGVLAATWDGGVFYRRPAGEAWMKRSWGTSKHVQADERKLPHFTDLAVIPNTVPGTVFLGAYDGLFRSDDLGVRWEEIETLPLSMILDFDVADGGGGKVALLGGTYWRGPVYSPDGGETWEAIGLGLSQSWRVKPEEKMMRVQSVAFSPDFAEDGTIYVGGRNTLAVSRDRGGSWEKAGLEDLLGEQDLIVDRMVFSPEFKEDGVMFFAARAGHHKTRRPAVFRSSDGGKTFEKVHEGAGEYVQSLVISPAFPDDGIVLWASGADRGGKVYRSEDGGKTWKESGGGLEMDVQGAELAIPASFSLDGRVYAGTSDGLFLSSNRGKNWDNVEPVGLPAGGWVEAIDISGGGEIAVTVRGFGHFISRDGGPVFSPLGEKGLMEENHLLTKGWYYSPGKTLRFSPHFVEDRAMFGTSGMVVVRSQDGGETWEKLDGAREAADTFSGIVWEKLWPWAAGGGGLILVLLGLALRRKRGGKGAAGGSKL